MQVKFWEGGDPPPCFNIDGINYIFVRKNGLLFAISTQWNVSPSMFLELLNRLAKVFKDYCGVLSEVRRLIRVPLTEAPWEDSTTFSDELINTESEFASVVLQHNRGMVRPPDCLPLPLAKKVIP